MKKYSICLAVILLTACQDQYDICDKPKTVTFNAGFYEVTGGTETPVYADTLSISILNSSSGIYNQVAHVSKFSFPLNPVLDSNRYYIKMANSWPGDTLTVVYSSQSMNISPECGNVDVQTISRVYSTLHKIDSVKLINSSVNTNPAENLKIYF